MKLAIFGSTGRTGRHIAEHALAHGHHVTAFARTPSAITANHPSLSVVQGDVLDPAAVERAVQGQEAALCALGSKPWTREPVLLEGTRNILAAMEKFSVKRFVCESSFGVGDSKAEADWFTNFMIRLMMGKLFEQKGRQEGLIRQSQVEWIIVRPARLTNGPRLGGYRAGDHLR